jgi:hypothetical protein
MLSNNVWDGFFVGAGVVFAGFFVVYFVYRVRKKSKFRFPPMY